MRALPPLFLLALTACAAAPAPDRSLVADPGLVTGAGPSEGALVGEIALDSVVKGRFSAVDQFDGYRFVAGPDAVVTAEIPSYGTTRGLDTTLFLYGPVREGPMDELAWDDNSGTDQLSRISRARLPGQGQYLLVVGTATGADMGAYSLALWCDSEVCTPGPSVGCTTDAEGWIVSCAKARGGDVDAAVAACTDDASASEAFADVCAGSADDHCASESAFAAGAFAACRALFSDPTTSPIVE